MENMDAVQQNQHTLLTVLMESMLKVPEITAEIQKVHAAEPEPAKSENQGERVDLLA